jgi:hypothetical protein
MNVFREYAINELGAQVALGPGDRGHDGHIHISFSWGVRLAPGSQPASPKWLSVERSRIETDRLELLR